MACTLSRALVLALTLAVGSEPEPQLNALQIVEQSIQQNQADFKAADQYGWTECDRSDRGSKILQVTMIDGTPYQRLIAVNGKSLSPAQQSQQMEKQEQAAAERRAESSAERKGRVERFEKGRRRDNQMMTQLTKAFDFSLTGQCEVRGFKVWVLEATPHPGYRPPNIETQVLPAMKGELWIDRQTFNWVKVTAKVVRPASIEGFLAEVEPGTEFELDKSPVGDGIWQVSHFEMKSNAKLLGLFTRTSSEDDAFFDYQRMSASGEQF